MRRVPEHPRDQEPSAFTDALDEFCRLTGARSAALVDGEGETVDYAGAGEPFDIRVLAAEWRLIFQHLAQAPHLCDASEFLVRARRKSFWLEALPEGYALVAELPCRAARVSERAISQATQDLCQEAGFDPPHGRTRWRAVQVRDDGSARHRPVEIYIDGAWVELEVLGRLADPGLRRRDLGFRVHLMTHQERNLVREPLGYWFMEEEPFG